VADTQTNLALDGEPSDLFVALDRSEPRRLRAQLEHALREAIQSGRLAAGTALPPSRTLARELAVARSVVVDAYGQLIAEGYLEARQGAQTRVASNAGADDDRSAQPAAEARYRGLSGVPDTSSFPRREWLRHYRAVISECPDTAFGYPEPQGERELRTVLAGYLGRVRAVRTGPEEVVISHGFAQGLALLCRVLALRGASTLAVEDPCFSLHRRIVRSAGLEPVPVAVDRHGLDVAALAALPVDAVLLSPAHAYPTGAVLAPSRRARLIAWARERDALIIEDDYDAELRYDRNPIGSLQGLAPDRVVYGGSASKMLSPALRLGWLAVPGHLLGDVLRAKFTDDIATEAFGQLTLARFIDDGGLAAHLRRVRPRYRARRDRLIAALARHMPDAVPVGAAAGLHLFVWLALEVDEDELVRRANAAGIPIEGGARHWADPHRAGARPAILIGYGALHEDRIDRMVEALGRLSRALAA
jgi:GntR family transcriptional regulator/MocR family aminotransferase